MKDWVKQFKIDHPRYFGLTRIGLIGLGRGLNTLLAAVLLGFITAVVAWIAGAATVGLNHPTGDVTDATIDKIILLGLLIGVIASGFGLWVVAARQMDRSISGTDPRNRHEAARVIVAQAVVARQRRAHHVSLELGAFSGGIAHVGWDRSLGLYPWLDRDFAASELCIELVATTDSGQSVGFADDVRLDRLGTLATRVVTLGGLGDAEGPGVHEVVSSHLCEVRRLLAEIYPDEARQVVENELLMTGQMTGSRFDQLLPAVMPAQAQPTKQEV